MYNQNFKNLILDYPREALAFFAQEEVCENLNQARIIPIRQEQLKDRLGDRFRELDVPLLVEWPDGNREAIVFVLEEGNTKLSIFNPSPCTLLSGFGRTDGNRPGYSGGHFFKFWYAEKQFALGW